MALPSDSRGRKVVVVCHCLLNSNSKVEGLALYEGVHPIALEVAKRGYGIVQMPCAEMTHEGMRRWGQTFEQYDNPSMNAHVRKLAAETAEQVAEFLRTGYQVAGVIGVDGSPTCGVHHSAVGEWGGEYPPEEWADAVSHVGQKAVPGVHIRALMEALEPLGVRFTAIDEMAEGHAVEAALAELGIE